MFLASTKLIEFSLGRKSKIIHNCQNPIDRHPVIRPNPEHYKKEKYIGSKIYYGLHRNGVTPARPLDRIHSAVSHLGTPPETSRHTYSITCRASHCSSGHGNPSVTDPIKRRVARPADIRVHAAASFRCDKSSLTV